MKPSEDKLTDYKLVLHEPVAPYVVHSYNMLMHLVQGLVLAALFFVTSEQEHLTLPIICNLIICLGIVVSLWYNFLTNNQYGSAMRASVFNTLIPILLGIFQVGLALAVTQPIYVFTLLIMAIFITVTIQLLDHISKHKNSQALEIWKEHYKKLGSQFAQDLFGELKRYEKAQLHKVLNLTACLGILTLFNYFFPLSLEIKTYISFIIVGIFIVLSVYFDLNQFFNNSEKLKKYGYNW